MKIYLSIPKDLPKTAITLGTFDGVHLGHRAIFNRMGELSSHRTVLTFINHPLEVINPSLPPPKALTPFPLKLSLLEAIGIDAVIALPFTPKFAETGFKELLDTFNLSHLVLGEKALFGKNREGTEENVTLYGEEKGFIAEYLPKLIIDGAAVSSSRIRSAIQERNFANAEKLLGRPHSILLPAGETPSLALPPDGDYLVTHENESFTLEIKEGKINNLAPAPNKSVLIQFK